MQEINYTIFDKVSKLPIAPYTDKLIRSMASAGNENLSEVFDRTKNTIEKAGIRYFIPSGKDELIAMIKGAMLKCKGDYFDDYEEALKFLKK